MKKRSGNIGLDKRVKDPVIAVQYLEQVTTAAISDFISSHVRSRGLAPKTANRHREILHTLFNWAMKEGGGRMPADKNPVSDVKRYQEKAPQIRFLTLKQIDEQLEALQEHAQLQTMVALYIYAGLRREEVLWLTRADIDLGCGPQGILRVRAKEIDGESWQPKTARNRAVPISSTLRSYLDGYMPRSSVGGWYFPSPQGRRYDPDNFSRDLRNANKKSGLVWTCLDFRHTFGSQLAMKGESLYKISKLMGNSPEICRRHYAALLPESLTDCVEFTPEKPKPSESPRLRLVYHASTAG